MLFNSFIFLAFLLIIIPIFYLLKTHRKKNLFLLLVSYFFYGWWDWRFCLLLAISTAVDYFIGLKLHAENDPNKRKLLLLTSLVINLGILAFFKYFNFFIDGFQSLLSSFNINLDYLHLNIILPVGISFYTFQTLSYSIDIYLKKLVPTKDVLDFALFVAFFPQLVAGPIERASNLLPQLSRKLEPSRRQIAEGLTLVITGLFRKVIIGDTAGKYVDHIFGNLELYKSVEIIAALLLFSVQIYADFSGYSHMTRGVAKLLGVELVKNFNQPYFSKSVSEFWRRWHISLSTWLRDYVYVSLGGNRVNRMRIYLNITITMLLGGLWHGASWNFVFWGMYHALLLVCHKVWGRDRLGLMHNPKHYVSVTLKIVGTHIAILVGWLLFRSESWSDIAMVLTKIGNWEASEFTYEFVRITLTYYAVIILWDLFEIWGRSHVFILKLDKAVSFGILLSMLVVTMIYMVAQVNPNPFIYFQF